MTGAEVATDASAGYDSAFVADFYDHIPRYKHRGDTDFYVEAAQCYGPEVIELGCGTGRILFPMVEAGATVTGLDISERMLERARERLSRSPVSVRDRVRSLLQGNVQELRGSNRFSLAVAPFRLLQFLASIEQQLLFLTRVRGLLTDEGHFAFDLFDFSLHSLPEVGYEFGSEPPFMLPDGRIVVRRKKVTDWNAPSQTLRTQSIFYVVSDRSAKPIRLVHEHTVRYVFRFEVEHLLARAGFEIISCDADFSGTPYGAAYPGEIVVVARVARPDGPYSGSSSGPGRAS